MDYIASTGFSVGQKRIKEGEILKNVEPGLGHMLVSLGVAKPYTASKEKSVAARNKTGTGVTAKAAAVKTGSDFESAFVISELTAVSRPAAVETVKRPSGRKKKEPETVNISDTVNVETASEISQE